MNVAVCVKQIPDPAVPGSLSADHTLDRSGKLILDESDSYGVEMALQLVDAAGGGEVTLISMAPNEEVSGLRTRFDEVSFEWCLALHAWPRHKVGDTLLGSGPVRKTS